MSTVKNKCAQVLAEFLTAYSNMCDDLDLKASKVLYQTAAEQLLHELPDIDHNLPEHLSDRRIQDIYSRIKARSPKSSDPSIALALQRLILICRRAGLLEGKVTISQRIRREEIPIHNSDAFALLDDFIVVRDWLLKRIQRLPRSRKDLPQLVIASLIALNGITLPSAPRKIGACKTSMLREEGGQTILDVPVSRLSSTNPPLNQYFLLPEIRKLLRHINGREPWLFPPTWTPELTCGKRKIPRKMNRWLGDLWQKIIPPERPKPDHWNITTFINCSRLYFALHCPPITVAYLSGRATFAAFSDSNTSASLPFSPSTVSLQTDHGNAPDDHPDAPAMAQQILDGIGSILRLFNRKLQNPGTKREAIARLAAIWVAYEDTFNAIPALKRLAEWMLDELHHDQGKRKMGKFQSMWQFIPSILVNELGEVDPLKLDAGEWIRLAEYIIQENGYSPATRSKIKQHLKSFHTWLVRKHPETERINWRSDNLRIATEPGAAIFPTFSEFERLFQAAAEAPPDMALKLQAALSLAFFCGLRAEEITLISKMDMDETTIQVRVWWSKTKKGRRRVPFGLLTPRAYIRPMMALHKQCRLSDSLLFSTDGTPPMNPGTLSKQVIRLIETTLPAHRRMTLHSFRHGFASWMLVRYFALIEPDLISTTDPAGKPWIPDADHPIFHHAEQKKLVRVFNGRTAGEAYAQDPGSFLSKPEHFAMISRMIGHATRDTTARTYIHSMSWLARYYIYSLARFSSRR